MRVAVLMSTYNGEPYVVEQLRSILEQLPVHGRVFIRDDGSSDGTVPAIRALGDPRISLTAGHNCGFGRSFLMLLASVPPDVDMAMFSDQDDVWLPGKIDRAWQHLQAMADEPALYGSTQMLVDELLRPLQATASWPRGPSFQGALTENIITGCTAALNRAAVQLLQRAGAPAGVRFHDWWLYLVVSAYGRVIFDEEPTILYRQHGGNQIGHGAGWWGRQRQIVRFLIRNDWVGILLAQVDALDAHYSASLPVEPRRTMARYFTRTASGHIPSWRIVFSGRRWRHRLFGELALRVLLGAYRLHLWPLPGRRLSPRASRAADA